MKIRLEREAEAQLWSTLAHCKALEEHYNILYRDMIWSNLHFTKQPSCFGKWIIGVGGKSRVKMSIKEEAIGDSRGDGEKHVDLGYAYRCHC